MTISEELIERIRAGNRGLQICEPSRRDHVDAMAALLGSPEAPFHPQDQTPVAQAARRPAARIGVAAALLVACTAGLVAVARSNTVPGDSFHAAKRIVEQPLQILDEDVIVANRLAELDELARRGAEPELVLAARLAAANAVLSGASNAEQQQTLALLAWPTAPPDQHPSVNPGVSWDANGVPHEVRIADALWTRESGFVASLADGHLVTISRRDNDVWIETTGPWTVDFNGSTWRLSHPAVDYGHDLRREGGNMAVRTTGRSAFPEDTTGAS